MKMSAGWRGWEALLDRPVLLRFPPLRLRLLLLLR